MRMFKGIVIALSVILILVLVFVGFMVGFPWERITAANAAKKYVVETYGLTPTKVTAHFIFDVGGDGGAYVSTKELPFDFDVGISRRDLTYADNDDYLNCLFEYQLN